MANSDRQPAERREDRQVADLLRDLSDQTSTLIRKEMELARPELTEKGKRAGIGAGLFGGSGLVALYGLGALVAAAILGLGETVDGWLSALIVAAALFLIAGVLALTGRKQVEQATPPKPEQAIDTVKEDVQEVKERAGRR
jgi:hypothetical protein